MRSVLNLIPNAVGQGQLQVEVGQVTHPVPGSFADPMFVILPEWSNSIPLPVFSWKQEHGARLPVKGTDCLIVRDFYGRLWCVGWGP